MPSNFGRAKVTRDRSTTTAAENAIVLAPYEAFTGSTIYPPADYPIRKEDAKYGRDPDVFTWTLEPEAKLDLLYYCNPTVPAFEIQCKGFAEDVASEWNSAGGSEWTLAASPVTSVQELNNKILGYNQKDQHKIFASLNFTSANEYAIMMPGEYLPNSDKDRRFVKWRFNENPSNLTWTRWQNSGFAAMQNAVNKVVTGTKVLDLGAAGAGGRSSLRRMPLIKWDSFAESYSWDQGFWMGFMFFLGIGICWLKKKIPKNFFGYCEMRNFRKFSV